MNPSYTHTILAKLRELRELREGGFDGKINPAMMRELTGIEQPGRTMYELFKGGYLVKAGKINLPAFLYGGMLVNSTPPSLRMMICEAIK